MNKTVYIVLHTLSVGGAERHASSIANYLAQHGYKVEIILLQNNIVDYALEDGVAVTSLVDSAYPDAIRNKKTSFVNKVRLKLFRALSDTRYHYLDKKLYIESLYLDKLDYFFCHKKGVSQSTVISFMTVPNIIAAELKPKYDYHLILGEFTAPQLEFTADAPENRLKQKHFPSADGFVFQTYEQEAFYTYLPTVKKVVIPNPIEIIATTSYHGTRRKEIVNYCKHVKAKNLPLLIEAFAKLLQEYPDYTLVIYGDGPERKNTEQYIAGLGIEDNVFLKPYAKNVLELVKDSAMFVSSSDREGISNSMLEAMAIGLPVISTDCPAGGAKMFIKPYENGIIVPVRDPDALYSAMKYMIENPDQAECMAKNAVAIKETLEKNKILAQWLDFLEEVQGEKMEEIMIDIQDIKKEYRLGAIGGGTLKGDLQSWWARKRGKTDPNSMIGQEDRLVGQRFMALNGVSLQVHKGEALGIIGGNGAGKSTLLKLLSRVTAPTEGKITLKGRIASMLEVGTGFHGELTGRENVYMNGAILGMTKAEIDAKMEDIIEFSEVREFIDTPVKRYSSGMYVKLAFSVAAHLDSEIMIMDEVLAVGDMAFQKKCLDKMKSAVTESGKTVLYVSHNMNTIRQLCDRCVVLDQGRIIYEGDVEKAIAIYMSKSVQALDVDIDLSNNRMAHLPKELWGKITHLTLLNKKTARYQFNEPIKMRLTLKAYENLANMSLRVELRAASGTPVGLAKISNFAGLKKGEERSFNFELDYTGLVNGEYTVCLVLYDVNEFGSFLDIDAVYPAFVFEVEDNENKLGLNWVPNNWGHICFHDIRQLNSAEN